MRTDQREVDGPETRPMPEAPDSMSRRTFVKVIGTGVLVSVSGDLALGQRAPRGGGSMSARLHIGKDGAVTVLTGKVEVGQGSRAEITQAAAEELRIPPERIELVMADTELCPDDGVTAGSRTTPSTLPAVRKACAAARELFIELAAKRWQVDRGAVSAKDGAVVDEAAKRSLTYAEIAAGEGSAGALDREVPSDVPLTPTAQRKVLGTSTPRPNILSLVTGAHRFPSDTVRPGMLHGKVLRPPSYGAKLRSIDLSKAKALEGVAVVRDGDFVGCAAPTSSLAARAIEALAGSSSWDTAPHPSSAELFTYLKAHARRRGASSETDREKALADSLARAHKPLQADYRIAYIQHAPLETRAAVAEWTGEKVTVWTGSQNPFGVRGDVARALGVSSERVRVIVPDTGGGFGGKHSGECAVEAARLARGAGRPVSLHWTREEEFTWAYFRPAGLIEARAGLDEKGSLIAWDFTNYNSGGSAVETPYAVPGAQSRHVPCESPLKQGSYRALASTANNFARECFMDELAAAAGADPLAFRLAHLRNERLRDVLAAAAKRFGWADRAGRKEADAGFGLACGTEKGSFVAACVEAAVDRKLGTISIRRVSQAFECGAIQNPSNLLYQVQGCIIMGLGGALTEEVRFEDGKVLTDRFSKYRVPRFRDVPPLDIQLLDRPDLPPVGAGETPIIAIAPAIGNAVFDATGIRIRSMPLRDPALKRG